MEHRHFEREVIPAWFPEQNNGNNGSIEPCSSRIHGGG